MMKTPRIVAQITTIPAIVPPTIAPIFVCFESGDVGAEVVVDDDVARGVMALERVGLVFADEDTKAKGVNDCVCFEAASSEEVLDGVVVVASIAFGTARRLSTANLEPHAIYSKD